jgi:hypothetical protein
MSGISRAAASPWSIRGKLHDRSRRGLASGIGSSIPLGLPCALAAEGERRVKGEQALDAKILLDKNLSVFL